ncbi:MAG: DUF4276 family protein [Deinococcales bacterium]
MAGRKIVNNKLARGISLKALDRIDLLEQAMLKKIGDHFPNYAQRFIPYISLHEFEALLFSEPSILAEKMSY